MMRKQILVGVLAVATATMALGCSAVPTPSQSTTTENALTNVPPHEVLKGDRQLMVAGIPMNFDQIAANLPETLTVEQANRMLVSIDPSAVSTQGNYSIQQGRYGFGRGFYGGFGGRYGGYRYYGHRGYYFPYAYSGGLYRRYNYNNHYPFFYNYGRSYYPYYYGGYGGYGGCNTCGY
ncbi:MAG: hypothetical protein ACK46X_10515 [Candidatus Sericytochromatia bacterium]